MIDEAVALHKGEAGRPVTDDDLREWGIDPESIPDEPGAPDAPWFDAYLRTGPFSGKPSA